MPRPLRIEFEDAAHPVMSRGERRDARCRVMADDVAKLAEELEET